MSYQKSSESNLCSNLCSHLCMFILLLIFVLSSSFLTKHCVSSQPNDSSDEYEDKSTDDTINLIDTIGDQLIESTEFKPTTGLKPTKISLFKYSLDCTIITFIRRQCFTYFVQNGHRFVQ